MTEEHKKKIAEGRKKAKEARVNGTAPKKEKRDKKLPEASKRNDKYILVLKGDEHNCFDFWKRLRELIRPMYQYPIYKELKRIEKELAHPTYWENREWLIKTLSQYFEIEDAPIQAKKERKKRKPMTDEQKVKLTENLKKAREARQAKKGSV